MGARESLNGRKNIYRRKKSKERREESLGTMSYQTSSKRSPPFWLLIGARKLVFFCFSDTNQKPERRPSFGSGLVRHCPQGLLSSFFTFLRSIYIFPPVQTFPRPLYLPLGLRGWVIYKAPRIKPLRLKAFLKTLTKMFKTRDYQGGPREMNKLSHLTYIGEQ